MQIRPAIDLIDGKCVRLTKGDFASKKIYADDPVDMARTFEDAGLQYLHLVDLDGAKANRIINYKVLEQITSATNLKVDFGGGLKRDEDVRIAFNSGASQITGGSIAVKDKPLFLDWLKRYGSDQIILGADARNGKIATNGWGETSQLNLMDFVGGFMDAGIRTVISTDIEQDGMLNGPSSNLYRQMLNRFPEIRLIASGGVSSIQDLLKLRACGCYGAIVGKAIYEGRITLKELEVVQAATLKPIEPC